MPTAEEREQRLTPEQIRLITGGKTEPKLPFVSDKHERIDNSEFVEKQAEQVRMMQLEGLFHQIEEKKKEGLKEVERAAFLAGFKKGLSFSNMHIISFPTPILYKYFEEFLEQKGQQHE